MPKKRNRDADINIVDLEENSEYLVTLPIKMLLWQEQERKHYLFCKRNIKNEEMR